MVAQGDEGDQVKQNERPHTEHHLQWCLRRAENDLCGAASGLERINI